MNVNKRPMPLKTIHGIWNRVDTNPDFQRPAVWAVSQKQLLVDTILRGFDVPKLYWRKIGTKPDKYDVVDGQQRLRAIYGFFEGEFGLPKDADAIDGEDIAGCVYEDLSTDLRIQFDGYPLDVIILEDTDDDEVKEMFLRLQNGTTLKAQEKRNAFPGRMRDFVKDLSKHPVFKSVAFSNSRFNYDLVAAQAVCLEIAGGPTNIKSADLNKMYAKNKDFDASGQVAKAVRRTFDLIAKLFPEKTPELERYNFISLYCVLSELQKQYATDGILPNIHDWFVGFEATRSAEDEKSEDEGDAEWISYKEKISHSTDGADSIRARMDFMLRHLLETYPSLPRKDNQRAFTHAQRLAVFRRDGGLCHLKIKCDGVRVIWDDWHCDHKLAWSKGGKTTVENGQVSCAACNTSKGAG